ncbi:hypothetical protein SAMN05660359_00999 [Geodermatophilus obscurus]|jgi:hypothetical protein|uniref:Uncharacterized protein n=1 Tax=Geodermatophilus obscurus TaxID=1861 RepID=A0A1I5DS15_9ACTN|nr:hypothetical protein [Geodermatophilus obscurus]SFO02052.1 hypothetical protein SAMN05660359_00999 [Geodermatophilus obscurus]
MSRVATLAAAAAAVVAVAGWLALVEVFWLPLRVAGVLVPLSVPAAVVANYLLVTGAHRLTGSRTVAVLPAITWLAVAVTATVRRPEGDLVAVGTGGLGTVTLAFLGLGVLGAAVAVGRVVAVPPAQAPSGAQR